MKLRNSRMHSLFYKVRGTELTIRTRPITTGRKHWRQLTKQKM